MARQLRALDPQAVAQLIVLDSITVDRNHAGSASDEALLLFFYWELVWFERSDEEVEPLPEGASLEQKLDHIVERAIEAGVLPAGTRAPPCSSSTSCSGRAGRHSSAIARKSATRT